MMVGGPSQDLLKQFAGQATGVGPTRSRFWGELITKNLPRTVVSQLADQIRRIYLPRLIVTQTGSMVGRIIPFGIGAVVGGVGNQLLGRTIVRAARAAFGPPPATWPSELAIVVRAPRPVKPRRSRAKSKRAPRALPPASVNDALPPPVPESRRPGPPPG
jgi:hypothetical protein